MYKLKLFLLPLAWLLVFMAFACAPADDDAPSSGPTINKAIYDFATAILTVQGTNLSPTEAQIQTIVVDGVALDSYTADAKPTGPDSSNLAKGKYRIKSDGTALWLRLTDPHKATLNGKVDSNGLKKGLLSVGSGAWAGLNTPKDLDVRNIPAAEQVDNQSPKQTEDEQAEEESPKLPEAEQTEQVDDQSPKQTEDEQAEEESPKLPEAEQTEEVDDQSPKQPKDEQVEEESLKAAITRATYHVGTALLTLQGTDLGSATQAQIQTIVVDGLALSSYIADATATGLNSRGLAKGKYRMHSAGTAIWLYLTDTDKTTLEAKPGMNTNGLKDGLLSVGTGAWAGLDTAKALAVSGHPPAITSATYNSGTGVLVITGTNLPSSVWGWDFTKLRFVAGNGRKSEPLLPHYITAGINRAIGSAASATSLTITLKGNEKNKINVILVKNGDSDDAGAYNLEAAAGFAGGSAADTSNNPITVSGYVVRIDDATYSANNSLLRIFGFNLPTTFAEWDFSKLTLVSGDGKKKYTLPQHATAGENTATGFRAFANVLIITLSGSVKAEAEKILVKNGKSDNNGAYNLELAAGFVMGSPADLNNAIKVSGVVE